MAYEISAELQTKINEYLAAVADYHTRYASVQSHNEQVAVELEQAEQELKAAMLATVNEPSEANRQAEGDAKAKVEKLKAEVAGSQGRMELFFQTNPRNSEQAKQVMEAAKIELRGNYETRKPVVLQRIEDAKKEYLDSLIEFHTLTMIDTQKKYYDIARQINMDVEYAKFAEPGVSMQEPVIKYRSPGFNYYGIFDDEILEAFKRGNLKKGAVRE